MSIADDLEALRRRVNPLDILSLARVAAAAAGPPDVTAPSLLTAVISSDGLTLTLTYNETLDSGSVPAAGAFSLSGTAAAVSTIITITGAAISMTLSVAAHQGETITLNYTPGASPIQDLAGNDAAALTSRAVTNNSTVSAGGPSPTLLTPLNGATFGGRDVDADTVTMFAEIPSGAPAVTKVEFFQGATKVGEATAAPWQFQWATTQGSYAIKARATYADTTTGDSGVSNITVAAPTTAPLPTTISAVKFWGDFGHANTLNPGGTQAAIGDRVASFGRFADGTVVTSQAVQATASKQGRIELWRGKKALATCTNTTPTTENNSFTLNGAQSFPSTLVTVYRGISIQSVGVVCGSNGSERIAIHNTTAPRNDRCTGSLAINDAVAQATATLTLCTLNNTNSRIMRQGVDIHNPAALGTTGVSNNISFPGTTAGSAEPGYAGDVVYAQGALTSQNITDLNTFFMAKFDLAAPEYRIVYVGDSNAIVFGLTSGGWRKLLHDYFHAGKIAGGWIEEVGTQGSSPRQFGGDTHDAVLNKGINYHSNTTPGAGGLPVLLGSGLFFQPDILVHQHGINNAASVAGETYVSGNGAGSTRQALRDEITMILNAMPAPAQLVVGNLINHPTPSTQTNVVTLNSTWFADVDAAAAALGRTVVHVDVNSALGFPPGANFQSDGHLTDAGCAVAADVWKAAIVKAAYKRANGIA